MTRLDLTPFYRSAIGFDRMANLVDSLFQTADSSQSNWPPYILRKSAMQITASLWRWPDLLRLIWKLPRMSKC